MKVILSFYAIKAIESYDLEVGQLSFFLNMLGEPNGSQRRLMNRKEKTLKSASDGMVSADSAPTPEMAHKSYSALTMSTVENPRPPFPPFSAQSAAQKVRIAEDAWNTRDPERVSLAYTQDSVWRKSRTCTWRIHNWNSPEATTGSLAGESNVAQAGCLWEMRLYC